VPVALGERNGWALEYLFVRNGGQRFGYPA
jgi:hypothetical protein